MEVDGFSELPIRKSSCLAADGSTTRAGVCWYADKRTKEPIRVKLDCKLFIEAVDQLMARPQVDDPLKNIVGYGPSSRND